MLIAVTGASGFIGRQAVTDLVAAGCRVRTLHNRTQPPSLDNQEVVRGSLDDPRALARFVDGADCVVHCAGRVAGRSAEFERTNVDGTANLARAAAEAGVARMLSISSLAAREPEISPYAHSKRMAEAAIAGTPGLAWDVFRPPAVYGPGDTRILIYLRLLKRRLALMVADPGARTSLIHVEDLSRAICDWVRAGSAEGRIYEIADPRSEGYSWYEITDVAAQELGVAPRYAHPPAAVLRLTSHLLPALARLSGDAPFLTPGKLRELRHPDWVCRDRAFERQSGWRPRIRLEKGLRATIAWYRDHAWI